MDNLAQPFNLFAVCGMDAFVMLVHLLGMSVALARVVKVKRERERKRDRDRLIKSLQSAVLGESGIYSCVFTIIETRRDTGCNTESEQREK